MAQYLLESRGHVEGSKNRSKNRSVSYLKSDYF